MTLQHSIVFVHIAKTAGTAFTNYLSSHLDPDEVAPPFYGDYARISSDTKFRLHCGHFLYRRIAQKFHSAQLITFLRDPIARSISQYKSWNKPENLTPWIPFLRPEEIAAVKFTQEATFDEFIMSENIEVIGSVINHQSNVLSGYTPDSPEFLPSAKDNVSKKFRFVGLTEQFQASLRLLRQEFPWLRPYALLPGQENRSESSDLAISPRAFDRIRELVRHDIALYAHAAALFEERVDAARRNPAWETPEDCRKFSPLKV
jgi:hypothetical protein